MERMWKGHLWWNMYYHSAEHYSIFQVIVLVLWQVLSPTVLISIVFHMLFIAKSSDTSTVHYLPSTKWQTETNASWWKYWRYFHLKLVETKTDLKKKWILDINSTYIHVFKWVLMFYLICRKSVSVSISTTRRRSSFLYEEHKGTIIITSLYSLVSWQIH